MYYVTQNMKEAKLLLTKHAMQATRFLYKKHSFY